MKRKLAFTLAGSCVAFAMWTIAPDEPWWRHLLATLFLLMFMFLTEVGRYMEER